MTRRLWWSAAGCFFVLLAALAAVTAFWGPDGLELVSWLAGTASLVVAIFTVLLALWQQPADTPSPPVAPPPASPPPVAAPPARVADEPPPNAPSVWQRADATGNARINQAGRDNNQF